MICSSVNRGGIYFVQCKSATETSLDMAAVCFVQETPISVGWFGCSGAGFPPTSTMSPILFS